MFFLIEVTYHNADMRRRMARAPTFIPYRESLFLLQQDHLLQQSSLSNHSTLVSPSENSPSFRLISIQRVDLSFGTYCRNSCLGASLCARLRELLASCDPR